MNPRIRRLQADHQRVMAAFGGHPRIHIVATEGTPPEKYVVEYNLTGLVPDQGDGFQVGHTHRAEVFLPLDYPRRPPFCRMITPLFHPNIDPQKICIGDHWSAGQGLSMLIQRIGEMISYQSYNTKSPLNARAAVWAETNLAKLPLEKVDLSGESAGPSASEAAGHV
jgi:ubiquitin-protein ligase